MKLISKLLLLTCCMAATYSYAQDTDSTPIIKGTKAACTDGCCCGDNNTTPIGIMTAHIHDKGKWMASYIYMNMQMQGNQAGTQKASDNDLYKNYLMSPEHMTMQMHMAMLMYGVTDRLTVMAMGGYATWHMRMTADQPLSCCPPGSDLMQSSSAGMTDTKVYALYSLKKTDKGQLVGTLGMSLPTGATDVRGITILGNNERLSYNMQPGTGSFAALPSVTYLRTGGFFSWGAQAGADVKLNRNNDGYKCGNMYNATAWLSHKFLPFLTASLRAEGVSADQITGSDPAINIPYNLKGDPAAAAGNYGGQWVNVYAGVNVHFTQQALKNFQLQAEYGVPVYQNLNGIQMTVHGNLLAGINYSF